MTFTDKATALMEHLGARQLGEWSERYLQLMSMPFDYGEHCELLHGKAAILDILWRMAGWMAGRPLRLIVEACLVRANMVFCTTAYGHRGLNVANTGTHIMSAAGREVVCCWRKHLAPELEERAVFERLGPASLPPHLRVSPHAPPSRRV